MIVKFRKSVFFALLLTFVFAISAPMMASDFADVADDAWYADAVKYCHEKAYFQGTSSTAFSPESPMDRAMLVTVLHRREGLPAANSNVSFRDVPKDTWYTEAVAWAEENDIVNGYEDGTFCPTKPISRQEIMVVFQRYVVYLGEDASPSDLRIFNAFLDSASVGNWAQSATQWCTSVGIICGSYGYLSPEATSTRAQIASVMMRLDSYLSDDMVTITFSGCGLVICKNLPALIHKVYDVLYLGLSRTLNAIGYYDYSFIILSAIEISLQHIAAGFKLQFFSRIAFTV